MTYILPLRWRQDEGLAELASYLRSVAELVREVIVVDGSPPERFRRHAHEFGPAVRHLRPHADLDFAMGKVDGVVTGVREARHERLVVADDDVRYSRASLGRVSAMLDEADLVRPQNFFEPLRWHTRLDTARILLNRAFSGDPSDPAADFPGTLAIRRSAFVRMGGYDGDALFENLELIRTVRAAGGRVASPLDLFVARRPPSARHWRRQRIRQAYDDFALPARMASWLAIPPALVWAAIRRRPRAVLAGALAATALAELGRRRAQGAGYFPVSATLLAPIWLLERGVCAWLAVGARVRGGARYGDVRLPLAANSQRRLRRRYAGRPLPLAERAFAAGRTGELSASKPISL